MSLSHAPTHYERTPLVGTSLEDLDVEALEAYLAQRLPESMHALPLEQRATRVGMLARSGSNHIPTVAGMVLFGLHPQLLNPNWGVSAVRIQGVRIDAPIVARADFEGPLLELLTQAKAFVETHTTVGPGGGEQYPPDAFHEAILNALIHRDLRMPGRVGLRLFDDRLELWNPGAPVTLTDSLEETAQSGGISMPRNMILASTARFLGAGEQIGRGLPTIVHEVARLTQRSVEFVANKTDTMLVLPSALERQSYQEH